MAIVTVATLIGIGLSATMAAVASAAITGLVIGAVVGAVMAAATGGNILKGALIGGVLGAVGGGIAGYASSLGSTAAAGSGGAAGGGGAGTTATIAPASLGGEVSTSAGNVALVGEGAAGTVAAPAAAGTGGGGGIVGGAAAPAAATGLTGTQQTMLTVGMGALGQGAKALGDAEAAETAADAITKKQEQERRDAVIKPYTGYKVPVGSVTKNATATTTAKADIPTVTAAPSLMDYRNLNPVAAVPTGPATQGAPA